MIQIKTTPERDLPTLCEQHFLQIEDQLVKNLAKIELSKRQKDFIVPRLREIITSSPIDLAETHRKYLVHCTAPGPGNIKVPNRGLSSVFNYTWFTKKSAIYYCGYDLAKKLDVRSCPYCNRNYTVTVTDGRKRVVRPDFDHFFPKAEYPLLALSFYNLVPSCMICNRTIKNQTKILSGKYIHPYEEGFENTLKINYFPNDVDSSVGLSADYEILTILNPLEPGKSKKCDDSFKLFRLKEIYKESHCGEIADIVRRHYVSNGKYLEILRKAFPSLGTIDELYRLAFGTYYTENEFEKRPLSKLTKDVVEQLVFDIPHLA